MNSTDTNDEIIEINVEEMSSNRGERDNRYNKKNEINKFNYSSNRLPQMDTTQVGGNSESESDNEFNDEFEDDSAEELDQLRQERLVTEELNVDENEPDLIEAENAALTQLDPTEEEEEVDLPNIGVSDGSVTDNENDIEEEFKPTLGEVKENEEEEIAEVNDWSDWFKGLTVSETVNVYRTEVVTRLSSMESQFSMKEITKQISELIDEQYPRLSSNDRSELLEIYVSLFKKAIDTQSQPPCLQNHSVPPLVALYHDGKFVQPWLKPIVGDLKKVFSQNKSYGERVFWDESFLNGSEEILQTMDLLTKLVTNKRHDEQVNASSEIANALRAYFIDTKKPSINAEIRQEPELSPPVLIINPIGNTGKYTLEVYRYNDAFDTNGNNANSDANSDDIITDDNTALLFNRIHELKVPRYYNHFIDGLFMIKDQGDPFSIKRKGRVQKNYSEKTPLIERVIASVREKKLETVPGQPANLKGFVREPLINTPSAFQIWYMEQTKNNEIINNPQEIWLNMSNVETDKYFKLFYALREEHYRKAKLIIVPYEELIKNPRKYSITQTWRDTYVIFLLPNRKMYTYQQTLDRLSYFYPNIASTVKLYHIDLAKCMQTREAFDNFKSSCGKELNVLTKVQQEEFDKEWSTLRSFIDYLHFLKLVIGDESDVINIYESLQLPTLKDDTNDSDSFSDFRIERKTLFSLNTLLSKFSLSLSEINPKLLHNLTGVNSKTDNKKQKNLMNKAAVLKQMEEISQILKNPSSLNLAKAQPGSGLLLDNKAIRSVLADNDKFMNEYVAKGYGLYPYLNSFKDSLNARIFWIMHSPDQGNLFFQVQNYNNLIKFLRSIDERLVPSEWNSESLAISYKEIIIHIENLTADRVNEENWKLVASISDFLQENARIIAEYEDRVKLLNEEIDSLLNDSRNIELEKIKYQGLYYLPSKLSTLKEQVSDILNIGIFSESRYYTRKTYFLLHEKKNLENLIKHYNNIRNIVLQFPKILRENYENILLSQNKCLSLASQARRTKMLYTLESKINDADLIGLESHTSPFILKLRQLDKLKQNKESHIMNLLMTETVSDGNYMISKYNDKICMHKLDRLRLTPEEFDEKYVIDNKCRICGEEFQQDIDSTEWDKTNNRPNVNVGNIIVDPVDIDDNRIIGTCQRVLRNLSLNISDEITIDPSNVDESDDALFNEINTRSQPLSEIDSWVCQTIKNIRDTLVATKKSDSLVSVIDNHDLLTEAVRIFQDLSEFYSRIDLNDIVATDTEVALYYPTLDEQKKESMKQALKVLQTKKDELEKELKILDPTSKRAKDIAKTLKGDATEIIKASVEEQFFNAWQERRLTIQLDKFITRYILLLEGIIRAVMNQVPALPPDEISYILTTIQNYLMNPGELAKFATKYKVDGKLLFRIPVYEKSKLKTKSKKADKDEKAEDKEKAVQEERSAQTQELVIDPARIATWKLLSSEDGDSIKDRFISSMKSLRKDFSEHEEVWKNALERYIEMGRLSDVDTNFYYSGEGFKTLIPPRLFNELTSVNRTQIDLNSLLNSEPLDLSSISSRVVIEELQKFLAQIMAQDSKELFRLIDEHLVKYPLLNEKNLNRSNTSCYVDMRQFYFEAILQYLMNNFNLDSITEADGIKAKLESILVKEFINEIKPIYDRIILIQYYVLQLTNRYNELIIHNHSITPNLIPYDKPIKTTYVDMSTGPLHTDAESFPEKEPIYNKDELAIVKASANKSLSEMISYISKIINTDLKKSNTELLISQIGNMPEKRVQEMRKNKNQYFEGSDDLLTQEFLNTVQLKKNLNINYSRFYHNFFKNLDISDNNTLVETNPIVAELFVDIIPDLEDLKRVLNYFMPEIPNKIIDRLYVYQTGRYGDRGVLSEANKTALANKNIEVAENIQDQSDEWIPTRTQPGRSEQIITEKLRKFLEDNMDDTEKCYQSMNVNEAISPSKANNFLKFTLFSDIYNVFKTLTENRNRTVVYSRFVYNLFQLMVNATNIFFQPDEISDHMNYIRVQKRPEKKITKNSFTAELARLHILGDVESKEVEEVDKNIVDIGTGADSHAFTDPANLENENDPTNGFGFYLDTDEMINGGEDGEVGDDNVYNQAAYDLDD